MQEAVEAAPHHHPVGPEDLVRLENHYKSVLEKTKLEVEQAKNTHSIVSEALDKIDLSGVLQSLTDVEKEINSQ